MKIPLRCENNYSNGTDRLLFSLWLVSQICEGVSGPGSRFKGKHSLDSDEEDEGDDSESSKYEILASDDVEGMSQHCIIVHQSDIVHWL